MKPAYRSSVICTLRQPLSFSKLRSLALLATAAILSATSSGCLITTSGLPEGLPQVPGVSAGLLSITTLSLVDSIRLRAYDGRIATTATATRPLATCTVVSGALPTGMTPGVDVTNTTRCRLLAASGALTAAAGVYNFTLRVTDTSVPPLTANQNFTIIVRNEFAVNAVTLATGVQGRTYGIAPLAQIVTTTALSAAGASDVGQVAEAGNGPITVCAVAVTGGLNLSAAPPVASPANGCRIESAAALNANGAFQVTVTFTDSAIVDPVTGNTNAVPPGNVVSSALALNVNGVLVLTANAAVNPPPDGVTGRTYGNAPLTPLTYTASGGLTPYIFTSIANANAPAANAMPAPMACTAAATVQTCTTGASAITAAAGNYPFTAQVDDAGNAAVPGSAATGTSGTLAQQISIFNPIAGALAQSTNPTPLAALLNAVQGRSYGTGAQAAGAPVYSASDGLGAGTAGTGAYRWCLAAGALPAGFTTTPGIAACATMTASPTVNLTSASAGAAGGPTSFTLRVDDTGNASVPPGTADVSTQLTIQPPLASLLVQSTNATPNTALFDAVENRSYAIGAQSAFAPTYSASGGLGSGLYRWCISAGALPAGFVTNPVIPACAAPPPGTTDTVTVTSNLAGAAGGPTGFTLQVDDTGNAAVPLGTDTEATQLTILAGLNLTLTQATNATPNTALLDAVQNRTYGIGAQAGGAPTYTVSGGTGPGTYTWCVSAGALPPGFVTTPAISTNCAAPTTTDGPVTVTANPAGPAGGPTGFTIQVSDAGTASPAVPSGADTEATQLTILATLTTTFAQGANTNPNSTMLDGVDGRSYGVIGGGAGALVYTASGGLGSGTAGPSNYGWCVTLTVGPNSVAQMGLVGIGTNCVTFTTTGTPVQLSSPSAVAGSGSFTVDVTDQANAATPAATIQHGNSSLTIRAALALDLTQTGNPTPTNPATLLDAVEFRTYATGGQAGATPTWTVTGGLGSGTAGAANYSWCRTTGLPAGFVESNPIAACAGATTGITTTALSASPAGAAAPAAGISYDVTDLSNLATPAQTLSRGSSLTILASLSASFNQAGNLNPSGALLDGVHGQSYGIISANAGAPTYTASNGLGSGSGGATLYRWCTQTVANTPINNMGFTSISTTCGAGSPTSGTVALLTASPATSTGGATVPDTSDFRVELSDSGNAAVPAGTVLIPTIAGPPSTITVQRTLAGTITQATNATPNAALLDAVTARDYGIISAGAGRPIWNTVGGLGDGNVNLFRWCFTSGALPPGFASSVAISNNCAAPSTGITTFDITAPVAAGAPGGPTAITFQLDDTGNAATPASVVTVGVSTQITIRAALNLALTQSTNATPNANLLDAVQGRTYGIGGQAAGAPNYTASGGLGAGFYRYCVSAGALPAGFATSPAGANVSCATPFATNGPVLVTANPAGAAGGPTAFTIQLDDTGNAAVAPGTDSEATQLTILAPLVMDLTQAGNAGSPNPTDLLDAVSGTSYGIIGGTPTYTVSGGYGSGTYRWCVTTAGAGALPAGFVSGPVAISTNCAARTVNDGPFTLTANPAGATVTNHSFTIEVDDTGNAAVPAGAVPRATQIDILAGLTFTLTQTGNPASPNPANLLNAVESRNYATGGQAGAAPTYTVSGGSGGPYNWCLSTGVLPGGFISTPAISTNCAARTSAAGPVALSASPAGAAGGPFTITMDVQDGTGNFNAAVPPIGGVISTDLTINAPLALSNPTPDPATNPAVSGRSYGESTFTCAGATPCAPPTYTASGGVGAHTIQITAGAAPTGIACSQTGSTFSCQTTAPTVVTGSSSSITVRVGDAGNAAVAAVAVGSGPTSPTSPTNFTVNAALASLTPTTFTNGLRDFPYQAPGVQFNVTGGLGGGVPTNYTWSEPGATPGNVCTAPAGTLPTGLTIGAATGLLNGTPTLASTGPGDFTFDVCVEDLPNATTPADSLTSSNLVIDILDRKAYVIGGGLSTIEVIGTDLASSLLNSVSTVVTNDDIIRDIALSPDGTKLYILVTDAGGNGIARVMDVFSETITTSISLDNGSNVPCPNPQQITMGRIAAGQRAYVVCGDPDAIIINVDTNAVANFINNLVGGATLNFIAFDETTDRVFIVDTTSNDLFIRDGTSATLAAVTSVDMNAGTLTNPINTPGNFAVKADGLKIYVLDAGANRVRIVDKTGAATYAIDDATLINPGAGTAGLIDLAITPDDGFLYVTLQGSDHFTVINLTTQAVVANSPIALTAGDSPIGVTIPPLAVGPFQVFIVASGADEVRIHDDTAPNFSPNGTLPSIALTTGALGTRIKHSHVPF
jgi:YVTN family beta-propeller protein